MTIHNLTAGSIDKHVRIIALPVCVGFFFNTMFNVVNTFFAAQISTEALAALTFSFPVFFIIIAFMNGLSTGSAALISNALGTNDQAGSRHYSAQTLSCSVFLAVVVTYLGIHFCGPLFRLLGAEGESFSLAMQYISVIFGGSVFFLLTYSANAILIAHGNSYCIRNFLIVGFFANCLLNPWLLYGGWGIPALGFEGIALATVLVMAGGACYMVYMVAQSGFMDGTQWTDFIPSPRTYAQILYQSIPAALNMMTVAIGIFVITYFVRSFGTPAVAAYGITMRIEQIFLLPTIGLSVANLTIVGQNNGAGRIDRVKQTLRVSLRYGLTIATIGAVVMFLFAQPLMKVFTEDETAIAVGISYLHVAALTSWAYTIVVLHNSTMQGMKFPIFALLVGLVRQTVAPFGIFYMTTQTLGLGLNGIWWGIFTITWTAALFAAYYVRRVIVLKGG